MLNGNASVNRLENENKINDQLMEIRKSSHQKYMLNSNMVITDSNKNKEDTSIHGNVNSKEENESINKNDRSRVKTKAWPKGTCIVKGDSMLGHIDETRMSRKFKVKVRPFPGAKTEDIFHYFVPLLKKCWITLYFMLVPMIPWIMNRVTLSRKYYRYKNLLS